jgi:hypothetical protein
VPYISRTREVDKFSFNQLCLQRRLDTRLSLRLRPISAGYHVEFLVDVRKRENEKVS